MEILLDTHCHTVASGHAYSTITEYVHEAARKNIKLIAITEHAPEMPGAPSSFYFGNLKVIPKFIDGIEVLSGVELNIMDSEGRVDLKNGLLKKLNVVIASLHSPCFDPSTYENHTMAVINTMKNPLVRVIGHLGDPRYPMDYEKVVSTAKETDTAIEINNSSLHPRSARFGGEEIILDMLRLCKKQSAKVLMASDSHFHQELGVLDKAEELIEKSEIDRSLVLNYSISAFKKFFELCED